MNELVWERERSKCESSKIVRGGEETVKQEGFPKRRKPEKPKKKQEESQRDDIEKDKNFDKKENE